MRRSTLFAAALLFGPALAAAQTSTQSMNVTAKVQSVVSWSNVAALDFGTAITPGATVTIAPKDGGTAQLTYNVANTVTAPNSISLTGPGSNTISVSLTCAQASTSGSTSPTAFTTDCATGYAASLVSNTRTDWFFYIGGSTTPAATTLAGSYTGTLTLTSSYTTY